MTTATTKDTKDVSKDSKIPAEQRPELVVTASNKPVDRAQADCAWVALFSTAAGVELTMPARVVDKASGGAIAKLLKAGTSTASLAAAFWCAT